MKSRSPVIFLIFLISLAVLWILCPFIADTTAMVGPVSYEPGEAVLPGPSSTPHQTEAPEAFNYYPISQKGPDYDLSMHVLEIDPRNPAVKVLPVTSHETLFGYALLSEMNERQNALASVNGAFSHPDGHPGGLYAVGGKLLTTATGEYPVLFMADGKAFLKDAQTQVWLEGSLDGKTAIRLDSLFYNQYPKTAGLYVFTRSYGSQNRISTEHLNAIVSNGVVRELVSSNGSYTVPEDGFLISAVGEYSERRLREAVKPGMKLEIEYKVETGSGALSDFDWAYECGSWILKGGRTVVPDQDNWVGTLDSRAPRTAVGLKEDGTLVFVVADGRQKGLSDGLTGQELAGELLELGIRDAAFLDGGASSEMIVNGKIVNSPSAGRERMLASCFVFLKNLE